MNKEELELKKQSLYCEINDLNKKIKLEEEEVFMNKKWELNQDIYAGHLSYNVESWVSSKYDIDNFVESVKNYINGSLLLTKGTIVKPSKLDTYNINYGGIHRVKEFEICNGIHIGKTFTVDNEDDSYHYYFDEIV